MRIEIVEPRSFSTEVADEIISLIQESIEERGVCTIALSGGTTPGQVYKDLSTPPRAKEVDWGKVKLFLGDERFVSATDPRSNSKLVTDTLLSNLKGVKPSFFPMPTDKPTAKECSDAYGELLQREVSPGRAPQFDVVFLGIGEDGHTASLFPHNPVINEDKNFTVYLPHPTDGTDRISITRPVITAARWVLYIVKGPSKASIIQQVLEGSKEFIEYPSMIYKECTGAVTFYLDKESAKNLSKKVA